MIKLKKVFLSIVLLIAICIINFFSSKPKESTMNFSISGISEEDSFLTVFYDNGRIDYPFDDEHMIGSIAKISDISQNISISIPIESIEKIRIDFGDSPGVFVISDIRVNIGLHEYTLTIEDCLKKIKEENDISEIRMVESQSEMEIEVSGNDGYLYFENLLSGISGKLNTDVIYVVAIGLAVYILYLGVLLIVQRQKFGQEKKKISLTFSITVFFAFVICTPYIEIFRKYILGSIEKRFFVLTVIFLLLYMAYTLTSVSKDSKR